MSVKNKNTNNSFSVSYYLKKNKLFIFLSPFFKILETLGEILTPFLVAKIIDIGIKNKDIPYILKISIIVVVLNIFCIVCGIIAQKTAAVASERIGQQIRDDLFTHINTFSHKELDKFSTATVLNRFLNDVYILQEAISRFLRLLIRSPLLIIGSLIMALSVNLKLSIIFIIVCPIIFLIVYFITKKLQPLFDEEKKRLDKTTQITKENLNGIRVVRAFNKQNFETERFTNSNLNLLKVNLKQGYLSAIIQPLVYLFINFSIVAVIYFGGFLINEGDFSQGNLLAFINYFTKISLSLITIVSLVTTLTKLKVSTERIKEVFETTNSIKNSTNAIDIDLKNINYGNIEFKNVSFSYNSIKNVVNNLSISIKSGQSIGIIGGTGSGKSSIINLIPRFYDVSKGEILINNINIKKYKVEDLRKIVGIVPQNPMLFTGTLRENLSWRNQEVSDEQIIKSLKIAQAYDFVKEYPDFLEHKVNKGGTNFSGGQKQRLTIARAIVDKPHILILDDSTSALDFTTDAKLRKAIKNNMKDTTTFIVTQRTNSIKEADNIIVVDTGNIIDIGKHEELLNRCAIYKEIHESQNKKEEN